MIRARQTGSSRRRSTSAPALVASLLLASPSTAQRAPAGSVIVNVARLEYDAGPGAVSIPSNEVALVVARLLDVAVLAAVASRPVGDTVPARVRFQVRNLGNAAERFTLSATAGSSLAAVAGIVADADGAFSPGPGASATIDLPPGGQRDVDVLVTLPNGASGDVPVTLSATATTGSGPPGTVAPGPPEATVGRTGASASARTVLIGGTTGEAAPPGTGDAPTLAKSQSVRAPDGSARVMPGSVVTYRLEARFQTATAAVAIDDVIPAGTAYVPGSLMLDGAPLSDRDDPDAGRFDGAAVHVALGDVAGAAIRTVQFQAVIQ